MFSEKDLQQIRSKGISMDEINRQISYFQKGFPFADIVKPVIPGNGVMMLNEGDLKHFQDHFEESAPDFRMIRFVPASGAASRMFKSLFNAIDHLKGKDLKAKWKWIAENSELDRLFKKLEEYPFYEDLPQTKKRDPLLILQQLLDSEGLNYANKPKGLLKFHKYSREDRRTAFEEHIREAGMYCVNRSGTVLMHLTVSPDHLDGFQEEAARILPAIEEETGITTELSFSFQKPETDTIAVDLENNPFRNSDGTLLFRPGGHGALIRNLDALDADIVFISNIDNVAPDRLKGLRVKQKQVLGGVLLDIRSKLYDNLMQIEGDKMPDRSRLGQMAAFLEESLGITIPAKLAGRDENELKEWLFSTMNRPVRVCGMVRNEGVPGGGPFYVRSESGDVTLQIVESSQVDRGNPEKVKLLQESSHFNPVDLVCSIRDYKGKKFNLTGFVDHNAGFISEKSEGGRSLKALELPGLWNGSMAGWLTLFVDVPVETFSPVKTVFDLARKEHQA
jgi:hypothetical protein